MVAVIDYGIGNLGSVANMLKKVGGQCQLASSSSQITGAPKLLLPGVGRFDAAMSKLQEFGWVDVLREKAQAGTPILGICLGMQLLADHSEEGNAAGLGLIPGEVRRFQFDSAGPLRVPHMGWNQVRACKGHPLVAGLDETAKFYFVHSYYFDCLEPQDRLLSTSYGQEFTSAVQRGNVMGVQFHPEKSHRHGMTLLRNFVAL